MASLIDWFFGKEHWLILIGIILAVLGAFYNSYGIDEDNNFRSFEGVNQGLGFGIIGGGLFSIGLGIVGLLLVFVEWFTHFLHINALNDLLLIILKTTGVLFLVGLVIGIIFGFIAGFGLNRIKNPTKFPHRSSEVTFVIVVAFIIMLLLSLFIQYVLTFGLRISYGRFGYLNAYLDMPTLAGCLISLLPDQVSNIRLAKGNNRNKLINLYFRAMLLLKLNYKEILLLELASILIFAQLFTFRDLNSASSTTNFVLSLSIDFIFSYIIGKSLRMEQSFKINTKRPSWVIFALFTALGVLVCLSLSYYLKYLVRNLSKNIMLVQLLVNLVEMLIVIFILFGMKNGRIVELIKQSKPRFRYITKMKCCHPLIDWPRFRYGFLVGFIMFGIYGSCWVMAYLPFQSAVKLVLYALTSWLLVGIPIGLMIGSIYGFGPSVLFTIKNMKPTRLGQIGIALTVFGIVLLGFPSLIG